MKSTSLSLIAGAAALAAVTGFAAFTAPGDGGTTQARATTRLPVERSSLLCPAPGLSDLAETTYTSFTPAGGSGGEAGAAELKQSTSTTADGDGKKDEKGKKKADPEKPVVSLKEPGKPATAEASGADAPALVGTATGRLAPGWTTQQTTVVEAGGSRGLLGVSCTGPGTNFWFPAASTAKSREDYVHLTNPDDSAAVADIELYGPDGTLKSDVGEGITVPARSSVPVLISTLTSEAAEDVTVHVTTRTGRVGAVVRTADDATGSDWLAASADPAGTLVLPGIPADATSVRLVAFAPGDADADLKVKLLGKNGAISPAGHEEIHVKSRMTAGVDLKDITRGETGSLLLTPAEGGKGTPVVAALRVVRGKGDGQEVGYIPATGPVGAQATAADNRAKGSTLSLTAPGATATVKVIASAGSGGGEQTVKTYTVKGGTTLAVTPPVPAGLKGGYALTIRTESGGPVHAARTLSLPQNGVEMFTVQTLPYDGGTVEVPAAEQDLSVLDD
ncbi:MULTISPECIES: DUF5719 family protein [unclassified Streptomyces]|uniref:DUF5719 family protein n=1 Tax=unclassified Streptomyces TaxID=2593676 RepID=UPI002258F206|nr:MULTISPECIES: DUF5719 family protein [unclassified Streptomyces]WSP55422.1 DUF5719 family protein [Streptomyces sp. NBC_01241]WSU23847.1 DUF5719 family protein [Streptomyces sp. NBC_01108]MCX4787104.1 DUF5719 family protein [Streptomyces sp. NBC_01221]MCX4797115.1 DUF5719 family protein [Streptomyces sp. NBC_01242]WSP64700.1 DUF5719 family protein [Streptomyces sp. NBC_01240]